MTPDATKCGADKKHGGKCQNSKGAGTDHPGYGSCKFHCGSTENGKKAAAVERQNVETARFLDRVDLTPYREKAANPLATLQELGAEALAFKDVCAEKVAELDSYGYQGFTGTEQIRAVVQLWERGMDRADRIIVGTAKLNLEGIRTQLAVELASDWEREHAQQLAQRLGSFLRRIGLSDDPETLRVLREELGE